MKFKLFLPLFIFLFASCYKARKCECRYLLSADSTRAFYINGNKKDSEKACKNMADSLDNCTLKK